MSKTATTGSTRLTDDQIAAFLGTDQWIYLAIGPNVWGRGFTEEQAISAAGINQRRDRFIVFACADPWAYINGMGDITYTPRPDGKATVPDPREYVEVRRRA